MTTRPLLEQRLDAQDGKCAICDCPLTIDKAFLDHMRDSGVPTGVLCADCYGGLNCFGRDPEQLWGAVQFLNERDG